MLVLYEERGSVIHSKPGRAVMSLCMTFPIYFRVLLSLLPVVLLFSYNLGCLLFLSIGEKFSKAYAFPMFIRVGQMDRMQRRANE